MRTRPKLFLDTSVLFAAVLSATGGARALLTLGEAGAVNLCVGPRVLAEADAVFTRKQPSSKATFALLLNRAQVIVGAPAHDDALAQARQFVSYPPDAHVVAEALTAEADYMVSLDRAHLVGNPLTGALPFPVGTPGDALAWLRAYWLEPPRS